MKSSQRILLGCLLLCVGCGTESGPNAQVQDMALFNRDTPPQPIFPKSEFNRKDFGETVEYFTKIAAGIEGEPEKSVELQRLLDTLPQLSVTWGLDVEWEEVEGGYVASLPARHEVDLDACGTLIIQRDGDVQHGEPFTVEPFTTADPESQLPGKVTMNARISAGEFKQDDAGEIQIEITLTDAKPVSPD